MKVPEKYRVRKGIMETDASYGNNGAFAIPHPKISFYTINCISSDGEGWEHVSVSLSSSQRKVERCPTWEEMCMVKDMFWDKSETVIQFHPAEDDYVNNHSYCLHLWRPVYLPIPTPDPLMVGFKL
jgi:hypothetical protein